MIKRVTLLLLIPAISFATFVTPPHPVNKGGTGRATLTTNNVILGNGTTAVQLIAPGTNGNVLTSDGSTWNSSPASGGSGTTGSSTVKMTLSGGVQAFSTIDGYHYIGSSTTLTSVRFAMGNCTSGNVVVGLIRNGSEWSTTTFTPSTVVPSATCAGVSTVSVPLVTGDAVSVSIDSTTASGEDFTIELLGI